MIGDTPSNTSDGRLIVVNAEAVELKGILNVPQNAKGLVILACGVDDTVPHQRAISHASTFYSGGLATLIVDLFTGEEQALDKETGYFRLNTEVMQQRISAMSNWLLEQPETQHFTLGYFGSGTSGAAALIAAAERPDVVAAVVSAGGRVDLVRDALSRHHITAATLLIAAEKDEAAVKLNTEMLELLTARKKFEKIPGASSLYEERRVQDEVSRLALEWFTDWLPSAA